MSTIVTQTAQYANTTLPDRPQDGETIYMDAGVAPQWPLWSRLYDRTAHHEGALFGHLSWSGDLAMAPGGSASSFTLTVGAINAVNLYGASASKVLAYAGGTIGASKIQGGGGTLGAVAKWWYLYAFNNAGSIDFEISDTAPNANRVIKSGDSTRVYLGCFPTLSTGAPIPFRASRGRYVYRASGGAAADTRVLNGGTSTSNTAVDCAALVPPHSRLATIRAQLTSTAAAFNYAYLRTEGDSGADEHMIPLPNVDTADAVYCADIETDADQDIAYRVTSVTGAPQLTLWVAGFYE